MIGAEQVLSSARNGRGRNDWQTPGKVLDLVRQFGPIGCDPATCASNPTGADMFYTEQSPLCGLTAPWFSFQEEFPRLAFCNPPYSETKKWITKAIEESSEDRAEILLLIASRTGTHYFAPCYDADAICFVRGRVTFNDADTGKPVVDKHGKPMPAPFDSVIVYWGHRPARFKRVFSGLGRVIFPKDS